MTKHGKDIGIVLNNIDYMSRTLEILSGKSKFEIVIDICQKFCNSYVLQIFSCLVIFIYIISLK